jgi:hypothetical protein|tara:strand:- start:227 stop:445 length:219 start_codon:yes stop_codon:yes gene_type:complete
MQKILNALVIFNFTFAGILTGVLVYSYVNQDKLREEAKERLQEIVVDSVMGVLDDSVPLPDTTGPAIPLQMP